MVAIDEQLMRTNKEEARIVRRREKTLRTFYGHPGFTILGEFDEV